MVLKNCAGRKDHGEAARFMYNSGKATFTSARGLLAIIFENARFLNVSRASTFMTYTCLVTSSTCNRNNITQFTIPLTTSRQRKTDPSRRQRSSKYFTSFEQLSRVRSLWMHASITINRNYDADEVHDEHANSIVHRESQVDTLRLWSPRGDRTDHCHHSPSTDLLGSLCSKHHWRGESIRLASIARDARLPSRSILSHYKYPLSSVTARYHSAGYRWGASHDSAPLSLEQRVNERVILFVQMWLAYFQLFKSPPFYFFLLYLIFV